MLHDFHATRKKGSGAVVQKPVNVNPGLKCNRLLYFVMFYLTT